MTTAQYYIMSGDTKVGPYDLVMLVRKIRNGSLSSGMLVHQAEADVTRPAGEWEALAEFFAEKKEDASEAAGVRHGMVHHGLFSSLGNGWRFLQRNQVSTIYSGMFVLAIITMTLLLHALLPGPLRVPAYMACFIFCHCLLSCFLFCILRMTRGQPVDSEYIKNRVKPVFKSLLLSSFLVSLPAILGLVLFTNSGDVWQIALAGLFIFAIPGLYILTLYAFTPLLVLDQGHDFWDAMEMSRKAISRIGPENTGVLFAMFVINFIAGLCLLIPLVLVLPITMSPLAEMYDESFS